MRYPRTEATNRADRLWEQSAVVLRTLSVRFTTHGAWEAEWLALARADVDTVPIVTARVKTLTLESRPHLPDGHFPGDLERQNSIGTVTNCTLSHHRTWSAGPAGSVAPTCMVRYAQSELVPGLAYCDHGGMDCATGNRYHWGIPTLVLFLFWIVVMAQIWGVLVHLYRPRTDNGRDGLTER